MDPGTGRVAIYPLVGARPVRVESPLAVDCADLPSELSDRNLRVAAIKTQLEQPGAVIAAYVNTGGVADEQVLRHGEDILED